MMWLILAAFFLGYNVKSDVKTDNIKFLYQDHWLYNTNGIVKHDTNCLRIDKLEVYDRLKMTYE